MRISTQTSAMPPRWMSVFAITVAVLLSPTLFGQAPSDWYGTWKLNIARSVYVPGPPPYKRAAYTIQSWEDGWKVTYEMVYPRGGVAHLEWTGRLDGKDYPLQGMDEYMTYAYTLLRDGSYEVTVKVDGRAVATSRVTLSGDGRTMTTTTAGRDSRGQQVVTTTVYEKQ